MAMKYPGGKGIGNNNFTSSTVMPRAGAYGVAWHEITHMFDLYHWGEGNRGEGWYPYIGAHAGIPAHSKVRSHVGPSWAYDAAKERFLSPTMGTGDQLRWRRPPERRGSDDAHWEEGMKITPLSDWSAVRARNRSINRRYTWLDADTDGFWTNVSGWHQWNWAKKKFELWQPSDSQADFEFSASADQEVFSILVQASTATQQMKNGAAIKEIEPLALVHAPIGPYVSNVKTLIDPRDAGSRQTAIEKGMCSGDSGGEGAKKSFCDFSLRLKRNGVWEVYALERTTDWDAAAQDDNGASFVTAALNLPYSMQSDITEISEISLLHTPNVLTKPWANNPKLLAKWTPAEGYTSFGSASLFERAFHYLANKVRSWFDWN